MSTFCQGLAHFASLKNDPSIFLLFLLYLVVMRSIKLKGVRKRIGSNFSIDDLDLTIPSGEFFALLGPSGCGKTSLLRLIAGLEQVDAGTIHIGSTDITDLPIHERSVNTVFQNYALQPPDQETS